MICSGTATQGEHPNWGPLFKLVGEHLAGEFMWIYEIELAGGHGSLQAYKHRWTRRYLLLSADGHAMAYTADGRYRTIGLAHAVRNVFGR